MWGRHASSHKRIARSPNLAKDTTRTTQPRDRHSEENEKGEKFHSQHSTRTHSTPPANAHTCTGNERERERERERAAFFQQGRGVRQGCSLSPTLFNIYINELAEALDRSGSIPGLALHDSEVKCLLYADDLVLLSPTAEGLQHSLALLEQYCEEWALTVNLDKTRVMVFQKKARSQGNQFTYGGEVLEHSTSYRDLSIRGL